MHCSTVITSSNSILSLSSSLATLSDNLTSHISLTILISVPIMLDHFHLPQLYPVIYTLVWVVLEGELGPGAVGLGSVSICVCVCVWFLYYSHFVIGSVSCVLLGLVVTTNAMETICCTSSEVKVTHSLMCLPVWLSASDAVLEDLSLASRTCVWPRRSLRTLWQSSPWPLPWHLCPWLYDCLVDWPLHKFCDCMWLYISVYNCVARWTDRHGRRRRSSCCCYWQYRWSRNCTYQKKEMNNQQPHDPPHSSVHQWQSSIPGRRLPCLHNTLRLHPHCLSPAAASRLTSLGAVSCNIFHSCNARTY